MGFFDFFRGEQPPLVNQAFADLQVMLENGHRMVAAATAFVLDNENLTLDLKALDREINQKEQDLRRALLEHFTVNPRREMLFSLKLISIVHEAERIGDLAKSLEKAGRLAKRPRMGEAAVPLRELRDRVLRMFDRARKGFVEGDLSAARALMDAHETLKDDVTAYLTDLAARDDLSTNEGIVYALTARLMSRVSSHLSNIASTVVSPFDRIRRAPTWNEDSAPSGAPPSGDQRTDRQHKQDHRETEQHSASDHRPPLSEHTPWDSEHQV